LRLIESSITLGSRLVQAVYDLKIAFSRPGEIPFLAEVQTTELELLVERLKAGDEQARHQLLERMGDRLVRLTRAMLNTYPRVRRWEQTDDVCQNAILRLWRALAEAKPVSLRHFLRLAALQIRRELIDLLRRHCGPEAHGAHHASDGGQDSALSERGQDDLLEGLVQQSTTDPARLAVWSEFHDQVGSLPDDEREVFDLLWYQGLSQAEVASLLAVNVRTIKRRWQSARLKLCDALGDELLGTRES
jgi:RNA polymerase sigma-70 factor (ECF subfamily)